MAACIASTYWKTTIMTISRLIVAAVLGITSAGSVAMASEPTLKEIMQGLHDNQSELTGGLLSGDADRVSLAATGIAEHPAIAERERLIIVATLGPEMPAFGQYDQRVHSLSLSISDAAKQGDLARAEREAQEMLSACFACHTAYKDRVSEALTAAAKNSDGAR
jgi:hypothetical protein